MTKIKTLAEPEKVPKQMQEIFSAITQLTDEFSEKHLSEEYKYLIRKLISALCRKRPSPLLRGHISTWAAGIIHALGMVNFLFDKSQNPYVPSTLISEYFKLGQSTMSGKSKKIRDLMKMSHWDANWLLPELIENSPMVWMVLVDGFLVDARSLPKPLQKEAVEKGLIPYLPEEI